MSLSRWCHPTISSSATRFSFCLQSFPALGLFEWGSSSNQVAKILECQLQHQWMIIPMNIQDLFPLGLIGMISLVSKRCSRVFSSTTVRNINSSVLSFLYSTTLTSIAWLLEKIIALTIQTLVSKVMSLLFNILSRFVISFLQRRKHLLILWLQVPSAVIFSSVQFSHSVVSDSLRPDESQYARPHCLSPSPRVHSDSHPSNPWCHPAISSSVVPFISCPQSLPASESFPMSQLFTWSGQSTGASALASFLPK